MENLGRPTYRRYWHLRLLGTMKQRRQLGKRSGMGGVLEGNELIEFLGQNTDFLSIYKYR